MTTYDFDVPLPPTSRKIASERRQVLADMPEGASFFFVGIDIKTLLAYARRLRPKRYTMRKIKEKNVNGVRVWRIEDGRANGQAPLVQAECPGG